MDKFNNFKKAHRNNKGLLIVVSAILIAITFTISVFGTYTQQHNQVNKLNQQITELNNEKSLVNQATLAQAQITHLSVKSLETKIYFPQSNTKISSPLAVIGEVPGSWSFEASFPVKLKDDKGNVIAQTSAQVLGDWMTDSLVPFSAQLIWSSNESGSGTLVLMRDNPSGLVNNDDSVSIPVKF